MLLLNTSSIAQPGFNIADDFGYPNNELYKMVVHNDTIYGVGLAYDTTANSKQGLLLVKYDTLGNLLKHNLVMDSFGDHLTMDKHWGKMIPTSGGGLAFNAAPFFRNSAMLVKVSNDLEVEFIKEYADSNLASNFHYRVIEIDSGYVLYGFVQASTLIRRPFIRRVDKSGEIVWDNLYGNPEFSGNILDIEMLNDSVLVAGSVHNMISNTSGIGRTSLYFVHLDGTLLDEWHSAPEPSIGYLRRLELLDDGGILIYGLAIVDGVNNIVQSAFSKLDQDFNVLWTKKYGRIKSLTAAVIFREIEPTIDGNFIAAGESAIDSGSGPSLSTGWLMKFSPEGDSIWSRYDMSEFPPHFFNTHEFGGVGVLSSGSIIAGGSASEGPNEHIWLVKVTNDGCLETIDCGLVPTYEPAPEVEISVFPNPCIDYVNIVVDDYLPKDAKVLLYNSVGQLLKYQPVTSDWNTLKMDGLSPGLYFYKIWEGEALLKSGKLVKVK